MKLQVHSRLTVVLVATVLLTMTGCKSSGMNAQEAEQRYHEARARIMLPMALQHFAAGDLDQAEHTTKEALQVDPTNAAFHILAGRISLERGRLERALHLFDRAIELDDKQSGAHYYMGVVFQRWQKIDEALACYQKARELEPDRASHLLAIGEMLVASDRTNEALELLKSKLTYFEHHSGLRNAIGQLYAIRGDYPQAIRFLRDAHLFNMEDDQVREDLALAQLAAGEAEEATRHLKYLASRLGRKDLKRALGEAYVQSGHFQEARHIYMRLTRDDPTDDESWLKLGEIAWKAGENSSALAAARRVVTYAPRRPEGYLLAGMVWQARDRLDRAQNLFARAAALEPRKDHTAALLLRGIALKKLGRAQAATSVFSEALRRRPNDSRTQYLLDTVGG